MKKALIVVVALLLAMPAVSYAGSATSRWDMTIGGYVKADLNWSTQSVGPDSGGPATRDSANVQQPRRETNSLSWAGGQTTLNFAIKGPDAMGAKTSAFVEGWFHGRSIQTGGLAGGGSLGTAGDYGLFALNHAFMQLIWPKTTLIIGQTWQGWGFAPFMNLFSPGDAHLNKGFTKVPQIRLTQALTKEFTAQIGAQAGMDTTTYNNVGTVAPGLTSGYPHFFADFSYATEACGKIGPQGLKVGVGGFFGKDKYTFSNAAVTVLSHKELDTYGAEFYTFIPIIPEKKMGDKAGSLAFAGAYFAGKMSPQYSPWFANPNNQWADSGQPAYIRGTASLLGPTANDGSIVNATGAAPEIAKPMINGFWAQGTFYLTNQWWINVFYGAAYIDYSSTFRNLSTGSAPAMRNQEAVAAILYDMNPAVRFGIQWSKDWTGYANHATANVSSKGTYDSVRFGAWYFF